jgi:solute carrier family 25 protein 39/40
VRNDGVWSLWDGLRPTLVMAVPNTMLYMVMYDELAHEVLPRKFNWSEQNSAIVAGGASRAIAGAVVAPLELVRTQMQASARIARHGMMAKLRANVTDNGFLSLWRGLGPTLWRDVPFSIVYWYGYEFLRSGLSERLSTRQSLDRWNSGDRRRRRRSGGGGALDDGAPKNKADGSGSSRQSLLLRRFPSTDLAAPHDHGLAGTKLSGLNLLMVSFAAGAGAGGFAAFVTTPFDVVKTQRQVDAAARSEVGAAAMATTASAAATKEPQATTFQLMLNIARSEGLSGWFTGVGPRVVKVAPACAIMISTYEIGKSIFAKFDDAEEGEQY